MRSLGDPSKVTAAPRPPARRGGAGIRASSHAQATTLASSQTTSPPIGPSSAAFASPAISKRSTASRVSDERAAISGAWSSTFIAHAPSVRSPADAIARRRAP